MTDVLIVVGARTKQPATLREAVAKFRAAGATVHLAAYTDPGRFATDLESVDSHVFGVPREERDPRLRRTLARARPARRVWLQARRSAWLRERSRRADLLVAADAVVLHTVWELAQRHPRATAVYGLAPAFRARTGGIGAGRLALRWIAGRASITWRLLRHAGLFSAGRLLARAGRPRGMRFAVVARAWTALVVAPGIPDRVRTSLAVNVHGALVRADRIPLAVRTAGVVAKRLSGAEKRAALLARLTDAEVSLGRPPVMLDAAVTAELTAAESVAARDPRRAAAAVRRATALAFDPALHLDRPLSPLVEDPAAFLAPLRRGAIHDRLARAHGRLEPPAQPPAGRPTRLLLAGGATDQLLADLTHRYAETAGVDVRVLDTTDDENPLLHQVERSVVSHLLAGHSWYGTQVEEWLRPHLDWADVVFIDRCDQAAAWFTMVDPGSARVVVRPRCDDLFTWWPHIVDFSRVDELAFAGEHVRDLARRVVPRLSDVEPARFCVLSDGVDLTDLGRGKPEEARFNVGLVGTGNLAEDPLWAVEVVRLLRAHDDRYRLLLIGPELDAAASAAARRYRAGLDGVLEELAPSGAVRHLGEAADLPTALSAVGVVLSSSLREDFPRGLVQGAASGAVPVARNWPLFATVPHGARSLLPDGWVVDTPGQAAALILELTAADEEWRAAGKAAAAHAAATWDRSVGASAYDRLLLGRNRPAAAGG